MKLLPRRPTPDLSLETVDHGRWTLSEQSPAHFTLLVFYRGHHCPLCRKQLQELTGLVTQFREIGIEPVAVSTNTGELAERAVREWELGDLPVGHGLSLEQALEWGLFLSAATKATEPAHFSEPGTFVIGPDRALYASSVQTTPFSRAAPKQLLRSLEYIVENDYPARGEAELSD